MTGSEVRQKGLAALKRIEREIRIAQSVAWKSSDPGEKARAYTRISRLYDLQASWWFWMFWTVPDIEMDELRQRAYVGAKCSNDERSRFYADVAEKYYGLTGGDPGMGHEGWPG
ncbi:hypothetical protein [Actinoalloteichus hymeniacidonis]|uniref:Uncharacterized protein n=1 Tax=Actinoalloteichus hymeniacidonis TaxID=340345 RepID=A0AAC9MWN5_9PSEU|nr:hypothetical protein [Actinoalloteichus hymeniacidonis]AOS61500.1 hypothetical protein TL08_03340 [Actinoalloteichus hymeniacidonis]MBB5910492.1 hypothetical protein [Actinoalloteichus hymeniacidonis]